VVWTGRRHRLGGQRAGQSDYQQQKSSWISHRLRGLFGPEATKNLIFAQKRRAGVSSDRHAERSETSLPQQ
jgi:hypothetical protein